MRIDHIHFFVEDAAATSRWFQEKLGGSPGSGSLSQPGPACNPHQNSHHRVLHYRDLNIALSSPQGPDCRVARYLRRFAPGVADVAVRVVRLDRFLARRPQLQVLERQPGWARIAGWGGLSHTLIEERQGSVGDLPGLGERRLDERRLDERRLDERRFVPTVDGFEHDFCGDRASTSGSLDHLVLNVPAGELQAATQFYQHLFSLQPRQSFQIQTQQSGLHSQVLYSPETQLYFNINEPASPNSQIQVFLDANRGAGIQHVALRAQPLVETVADLRRRGLPLLPLAARSAARYYAGVRDRLQPHLPSPQDWQRIIEQQILVDGSADQPGSLLLQIFSQPIFSQPTFFLSLLSDASRPRALARAIFWRCIRRWKRSWNAVRMGRSARRCPTRPAALICL